ncbi:hypothetical protein AAVH_32337, partial [Aphelenchoides avenae]
MKRSFECVYCEVAYFDVARSGCPEAIRNSLADFGQSEELNGLTTIHVTGLTTYSSHITSDFEPLLDFLTALSFTMTTVVLDIHMDALRFLDALLERNQAPRVQSVLLQSLSTPYEDDTQILIRKQRSVYAELFLPTAKGISHLMHFDVAGTTIAAEIEVEQRQQYGWSCRYVETVRLSHVKKPATHCSARGRSNLTALPPE